MKNKINILLFIVLAGVFASCDSYDFNQEQYKNELYLQSSGKQNIFVFDKQEADMTKGDPIIKIAIGLSGSRPSKEAMSLTLIKGDSLIKAYNKSNFDVDSSRFSKVLAPQYYDMETLSATVQPGRFRAEIPIKLKNIERLSPDSTYFLDYKIDKEVVTSPFNRKNFNEVLLKVIKKNYWATTKNATNYFYHISSVITPSTDPNGNADVKRPTSTNRCFPLTANSVRFLAGVESWDDYKKAEQIVTERSIEVVIGKQTDFDPNKYHLTIKPYKKWYADSYEKEYGKPYPYKTIEVEQMVPIDDYDNTYYLNIKSTPDGRSTYYKEFRLHYKYRLSAKDNNGRDVPFKEVKAILRYQFNPRAEQL